MEAIKRVFLSLLVGACFSAFATAPEIPAHCLALMKAKELEATEIGLHHLKPVESYNDVLAAITANPYDYRDLPIIPIVNFDFSSLKYPVGVRSRDILTERHVILPEYRRKPIHPMGIPVEGKMVFYGGFPWTGVFRGGEFPVIARLSLSQGNPLRTEVLRDGTTVPQVRSSTMGILLFDPNKDADQVSPIVSLVLQNDLNGIVNPDTGEANNFLDQTVLNKPLFDPGKLVSDEARLYHYGTLGGVFFGALQSPWESSKGSQPQDVESPLLGVDPLLRPPHGFANFGETNPREIQTPVWLSVRPRAANPEIVYRNDFRQEIYETLQQGSYIYDIYASDTVNSKGEKIWEHVGHFEILRAHLPSQGADEGIIIPHADVSHINYATGQSIYNSIRVIE